MFEKDAEYYAFDEVKHKQEWYIKHPEHSIDSDSEDIKKHWEKGAEFGYNKANEWHYVSKKDYPKDKTEKKYLVALKSEYGGFFYEIDIWCESLHCFASNNPTKVYAWKEIVLPELPKEK